MIVDKIIKYCDSKTKFFALNKEYYYVIKICNYKKKLCKDKDFSIHYIKDIK